jgi:hypothetical protein
MNESILDDFLTSIINQGINGIRTNDLSAIVSAVDFIRTRIDGALQQASDPNLPESVLINQTRTAEILGSFKILFDIYIAYLQDTAGQTPYATWFTERPTQLNSKFIARFGQGKPVDVLYGYQPIAYTLGDLNGDGLKEEIIPELGGNNQVLTWKQSQTPNSLLYKTLRFLVEPLTQTGVDANGNPIYSPQSMNSTNSLSGGAVSSGLTMGGATTPTNSPPPMASTVTNRIKVGTCAQPAYSFGVKQDVDPLLPAKRIVDGFAIDQKPGMLITMYAACADKGVAQPPVELFTKRIESKVFWTISENSRGDLSIAPQGSNQKSVGKISYEYYYDLRDILNVIYNGMSETTIHTGETVVQNIKAQFNDGLRVFVDNHSPTMALSPRQNVRLPFYDKNNPSRSFITGLADSVKNVFNIDGEWYANATSFPQMTFFDNFTQLMTIESSLTFNDVFLSNRVTSRLPKTDLNTQTVTSILFSKKSGVAEQFVGGGNQGVGTPTTTTTPGFIPTGTSANEIKEINKFYGVLSTNFPPDSDTDCSTPNALVGFKWVIDSDKEYSTYTKQYIDYPELKGKLDEINMNEVTGQILDIIRSGRNSAQFQSIFPYLVPVKNTVVDPLPSVIPNNPCLIGVKTDYQWAVKRKKIIPYKIYCNAVGKPSQEINYRIKGTNAYNWMVTRLLGTGVNWPVAVGPNGELLTTPDGYFYYTEDTVSMVVGIGAEFSSYDPSTIKFQPSAACTYTTAVEESWRLDIDNPCGCDEVEILTHYIVYAPIEYTDPLYGTKFTLPEQRFKDPSYPTPEPESLRARYGLSEGQDLSGNRRQKIDCFEDSSEGRPHHPFLYGTDILTGIRKASIKGLFNTSQSLECYFTSSLQSNESKDYYYEITDCDNCNKTSYFAVAYGNYKGSGSLSSGYESDDSPSRAIYSQYRLLALDASERYFKFFTSGSEVTPDDIYAINFYRNGLSDKLDIGNFEINIAELSGSGIPNNVHTGSKVKVSGSNPNVLSLIDNSSEYESEEVCSMDNPLYSYSIVSGSLKDGIHTTGIGNTGSNAGYTTYGFVYPNLGVIVLDGSKLSVSSSFNSVTGSNIAGDNAYKLFTAISGAAAVGKPMRARNVKYKTTNHYFVRIPSGDANYSNNPTYVYDTEENRGKIKNACFIDNPMSYITTVGLYNSRQELLAIAKLSRPIKKTRENDVLIKIRLNW